MVTFMAAQLVCNNEPWLWNTLLTMPDIAINVATAMGADD